MGLRKESDMSVADRVFDTIPGCTALIGQILGVGIMFGAGFADNDSFPFLLAGCCIAVNAVLSSNVGILTKKGEESPYREGLTWGAGGAGLSTSAAVAFYGAGVGISRIVYMAGPLYF